MDIFSGPWVMPLTQNHGVGTRVVCLSHLHALSRVTQGQHCRLGRTCAPTDTELSTAGETQRTGGLCPPCPPTAAPPWMDSALCHRPPWPWPAPRRCCPPGRWEPVLGATQPGLGPGSAHEVHGLLGEAPSPTPSQDHLEPQSPPPMPARPL